MTQFTVLTLDAKAIVVNFFNAQKKKNTFCKPNKQLMVSLYSLMPGADTKIIGILNEYMIPLSDHFQESEIELLKSEYSAVVKYCYDHKDYGEVFLQNATDELPMPQDLIDLCMGIAEPKAGSSVLVPYSGVGSFAYHVADCMIDGFEINEIYWALSQVLLHSQHAVTSIKLQDTIDSDSKQYEYIFSFPPMLPGREGRKVVDLVYDLITKRLQEGGELYCILPMNFCSIGSGWFDVRKILWDYRGQYSVLVVSLPPILHMSGVSLCLLHVKKNHKDIVALMDATGEEFSARRDVAGYKEHVLKVQSIIETINSQDEKYVWVGNSKQLTGSVSLQPSRYLLSQNIPSPKKGERSFKLSDIIQLIPMTRRDEETLQIIARRNRLAHPSEEDFSVNPKESAAIFARYRELEKQACPLIGMKELSSSYLNCDINRDALNVSPGVASQYLTSDCLLIGFIGGKFKVGRLHGITPATPVALKNEVIPVKLSSDVVTEDFLLRCIMSEPTEYQARVLATETTISRLSKQDLLSIVINVPELKEQQDAICKEDTRSCLTEADRKLIESHEEFRKDMHMKKHAIGQTLFNLNNWWDALQQARKEGNGIVADNATTGKIRKISVSKIYDSLQNAIDQLQQQINKFDRGNGLAIKKFALTLFIEDYIARKQSPLFEFHFNTTFHHTKGFEYDGCEFKETSDVPQEYVEFAPDALEIIFDNIVSNACSHGFNGREDKRNLIKIELKSEGDNYVIVVSNNGEAMHNQIKPEDVFIYGKTSKMGKASDKTEKHFGIGGYEVQKLMREFGGAAEFVSEPESDFPVSYKLTFFNSNF